MFLEKANSTSIRPNGSLTRAGKSRAALGNERWARLEGGKRVGRVGCRLAPAWEGESQGPSSAAFPGLLLQSRGVDLAGGHPGGEQAPAEPPWHQQKGEAELA